jgi:protein-S-isoprenylcysteine O-methyltransferase Ste14
MTLGNLFYAVATGSRRRRALLTPIGLAFGVAWILLPVLGGLYTDTALGLPRLLPPVLRAAIGIPLLTAGFLLHVCCLILFAKAKGTGVPFNPPPEVVTRGPYAWTRNPMLIGLFAGVMGVGLLVGSVSIVSVWTPVFIVVNVIEVKLVEEPELERRLGAGYMEYKGRVPMFFPRAPRGR